MRFLSSLLASLGFFLIAALLPTFAGAADFYVSPLGSDNNPGTQSAPFKTVTKGINTALDGDIVYIKDGTYNLEGLNTTLYKSISLIGDDKNTTILTNGRKITFHKAITVRNLQFKNFAAQSYDDAVFRPIVADGEIIEGAVFDNLIIDNVGNFIWGENDSTGTLKNITISNNTVTNVFSSVYGVLAVRLNTRGELSNITIVNNIFRDIRTTAESYSAYGILIGSDENNSNPALPRPNQILIENNIIEHIFGGTYNPTYPPSGKGIMIYGEYITINRNSVLDINPAPAHEGIYIKANHSRITNNIVHNGGTYAETAAVGAGDICIKGDSNFNLVSGNRVTSDYPEPGIGIYAMGGVEISNNYVKKPSGYFGIFAGDSIGKNVIIKDNYLETEATGSSQGIKLSSADSGEVAYNSVVTYLGQPMYISSTATNISVHDNILCRGDNCGTLLPPNPSCQNTGNLCCPACQANSYPEYNSTCALGQTCCDLCQTGLLPSPTPPSIQGDVNGDGKISLADFLQVASRYGNPGGNEDINADGKVNGLDLGIVLKNLRW